MITRKSPRATKMKEKFDGSLIPGKLTYQMVAIKLSIPSVYAVIVKFLPPGGRLPY